MRHEMRHAAWRSALCVVRWNQRPAVMRTVSDGPHVVLMHSPRATDSELEAALLALRRAEFVKKITRATGRTPSTYIREQHTTRAAFAPTRRRPGAAPPLRVCG
jgi:hypothetical protein